MSQVRLNQVNKIFANGYHAVKDASLSIEDREFVVLVGPSGCGKTTTLRMIAGLESVTSGQIYIGDKLVNEVSPKDRDIAMVFQNYALYPHKTVYDNMAFGLKLRKVPKQEIQQKVLQVAKMLGIEELLERKPSLLSGGQRQRVALGRAIVRDPQVFLMDEPLSNLDAKLRVSMRAELIKLHQESQRTFIYVTHDQTEAMTMGSKIVVMNQGVIQQIASPRTIYNKPDNIFVATFIGTPQINLVNCRLVKREGRFFASCNELLQFPLEQQVASSLAESGYLNRELVVGIRPEAIEIKLNEDKAGQMLRGKVEMIEVMGAETCVYVRVGHSLLTAKLASSYEVKSGDEIKFEILVDQLHYFDPDSTKRIL